MPLLPLKLLEIFDERRIDYQKVILSNLIATAFVTPNILLLSLMLILPILKDCEDLIRPLPMYHNNLWDTNAFVRVIVTSSSFWHMYQSTRKENGNFSSHSEPI